MLCFSFFDKINPTFDVKLNSPFFAIISSVCIVIFYLVMKMERLFI